ncbi:MAG: SdpI family protein [Oscillospiraceae bacterium]|nr:SdpI family protein [Oscillospiraceae bacterium]
MDKIMEILGGFDIAKLLPEVNATVGFIVLLARIITFFLPLLILGLGLTYFLKPPAEANHTFGYRTYFGMGSVEAWQFSQRIGGLVYIILGGVMTLGALVAFIILLKGSIPTVLTGCAACVVVELILVALTTLTLNIIISIRYDRDGYRRGTR